MTVLAVQLPKMLQWWKDIAASYDNPIYCLLLCGDTPGLDAAVHSALVKHTVALDDMSSVYCVFTVIGDPASLLPSQSVNTPLESAHLVHVLPKQLLDGRSTYSLAHTLGIDLSRLPSVLLIENPWTHGRSVEYSIREFIAKSDPEDSDRVEEEILLFFGHLFTACRDFYSEQPGKRIQNITRFLDKNMMKRPGRMSKLLSTNIIAQIVEGIVKGVTPT